MESCTLILKLSDDAFGTSEEAAEILLLEADLNSECAKIGAGQVARVERGGGVCEILITGDDADVIFSVMANCLILENLPHQSKVVKQFEHEGQLETITLFEA